MIDNKKLLVVLSLAYGHNMHQDESVFITIPTMGAK